MLKVKRALASVQFFLKYFKHILFQLIDKGTFIINFFSKLVLFKMLFLKLKEVLKVTITLF